MTTADDSRIDPSAVEAWYAEHARDLRAFLIGVLKNDDLAGEALQAAFTKALEAGHTAREESIRGWLFRVAYREAFILRRKQKIHEKSIRKAALSRPRRPESPEEQTERQELKSQVATAISVLPEEQRKVVWMRVYEEKTFAEIAQELNAPLGTVLTRMRLALRKLHAHLDAKDRP